MSPRLSSFGLGLLVGATAIGLLLFVASSRNQQAGPNPAPAVETNTPASDIPQPSTTSFDWRTVESEEYPKYIANLRAIGCPEETIRDIIIADVNKLFETRRKTLSAAKTNRFEYWKTGNQRFMQAFDEEKVAAQHALARERRLILKELLGFEPEEKLDYMPWNPLEEMLAFLAPSKRVEVMEFEQRFNARRVKLMSGEGDLNVLRMFEKQREAELATLLSPEELEEYQLRRSNTAGRMAGELATFEPTEQEFREIFKLRSQVEDEFGLARNGGLGSAATAKLEEGLKRLLGDTRYAEYERSQDFTYQAVRRVADKNGFDKDAADKIYELRKAADAQAGVVRQDDSLSREQRSAALSAIRKEADSAARAVFSHEAILALESQGSWLGHIAPPATPVQHQ